MVRSSRPRKAAVFGSTRVRSVYSPDALWKPPRYSVKPGRSVFWKAHLYGSALPVVVAPRKVVLFGLSSSMRRVSEDISFMMRISSSDLARRKTLRSAVSASGGGVSGRSPSPSRRST